MPYKSFNARPYKATDKAGNPVDLDGVMSKLRDDAKMLAHLVEFQIKSDPDIRQRVSDFKKERPGVKNNDKIGELLSYDFPKSYEHPGKSGKSRFLRMYQHRLISEVLSWIERSKVTDGTSEKRVSQGWKRTANDSAPSNLQGLLPLSAADGQYSKILNNPFADGFIELYLVVSGVRHVLYFKFDRERFAGAKKLCRPNVRVDKKGSVRFVFSVEYEQQYPLISGNFVVGVDVGRVEPATISVLNAKTGEIVEHSTLSRRVHSLNNSIRRSEKQRTALFKANRKEESAYHRRAASRKKREMAILIGQEIANISAKYGNALVVVEDLSWIKNTMDNGRWNRGEVVRRTEEFVTLNGGRVYKVNAAYSSQKCHKCHEMGYLFDREFVCENPGCSNIGEIINRDVNAAGELASRVLGSRLNKTIATRKATSKKKNHPKQKVHTPATREVLKYPGRDRTKNAPTAKRVKPRKIRTAYPSTLIQEVKIKKMSTAGALLRFVPADGLSKARNSARRAFSETVTCCSHSSDFRARRRFVLSNAEVARC